MVAGNYHKQKGFGFGGFEWSRSVRNLRTLTLRHLDIPAVASEVVLIDVHTGLGPSGVDTLLLDSMGEGLFAEQIEAVFPTEEDASGTKDGLKSKGAEQGSVASGYELTIGSTTDFCVNALAPHLSGTDKLCLTQVDLLCTGFSIGVSHCDSIGVWHGGFGFRRERSYYAKKLKSCFLVDDVAWKNQVVRRGRKVFLQGLKKLMGESDFNRIFSEAL
eukprot:gene34191-45854_t